jgi:uncharacterized membrane protein YjjB (DUF3815 family)
MSMMALCLVVAVAAFFGAFCGSIVGTMWATAYRDMKPTSNPYAQQKMKDPR